MEISAMLFTLQITECVYFMFPATLLRSVTLMIYIWLIIRLKNKALHKIKKLVYIRFLDERKFCYELCHLRCYSFNPFLNLVQIFLPWFPSASSVRYSVVTAKFSRPFALTIRLSCKPLVPRTDIAYLEGELNYP